MNRPYFKYSAKQLASVLVKYDVNEREVRELLTELEYRRPTPQNEATKAAALIWLSHKSNTGMNDSDIPKAQKAKSSATQLILEDAPHSCTAPPLEASKSPEDNSTKLNFVFEPSLWGRLIGAQKVTFANLGVVEMMLSENESISLPQPLPVDFTFSIENHFLKSILNIYCGGQRLQVRVAGTQRLQIIQYLGSRREVIRAQALVHQYSQMMDGDNYLNYRQLCNWISKAKQLVAPFEELIRLDLSWISVISKMIQDAEENRRKQNSIFIERKKTEFSDFFLNVESSPLTNRQIEAILTDDDAVLVNAGAGTGKTSTVVGKIGYLVRSETYLPSEILALAYGRDAAAELKARVKKRLGIEVEVRTFHSLGLELMQKAKGHRVEIADVASDEKGLLALIARLLQDTWKKPETQKLIREFISAHRYPAKYLEDFNSQKDYMQYMRKIEPRTLKGEKVKSFEELLIADWLLINGIAYEYEKPYEIDIASTRRRQYRPDFYITNHRIYLEHFGLGKNGETAPGVNSREYKAQIQWKRELHKNHSTTLVETFSWQRQDGILFDSLAKELSKRGVPINPSGGEEIQNLIQAGELNKKLVSLLKDFLVAFKENQLTFDNLNKKIELLQPSEKGRVKCFLGMFEEIYSRYQAYLVDRKQFDFSDCISESTKALAQGLISLEFKRVIVDEYQDISNGRFNLLNQILTQRDDCRLMAVGDDWQSIYGFTGSDIEKSTKFTEHFKGAEVVPLNTTFRFTKPIIAVSSDFVQSNPEQLRKQVDGGDSTVNRPIHVMCAGDLSSVSLEAMLAEIDNERPSSVHWKVFLLGRYNFLCPKENELKLLAEKFPKIELEFVTIHASKGREADAVVILNLVGGRYGFPGSIERDPLMNLVIPGEDSFPDAEERRVLYVALTRARTKVVISARTDLPSSFLSEIQNHKSVTSDKVTSPTYSCPTCSSRLLLSFPKRINGYAWQCENHPYCTGEARMCGLCRSAPIDNTKKCMSEFCKS